MGLGWDDFERAWDDVEDNPLAIINPVLGGQAAAGDAAIDSLQPDIPQADENESPSADDLLSSSLAYGQAMIEANVAATKELAQWNLDRFPEVNQVALDQSQHASSTLNQFMAQEFEASLDRLYPQWRTDMVGAAARAQKGSIELTRAFEQNVLPGYIAAVDEMSQQALATNAAMLRGEVPADVQAAVERSSAEISMQMGVRGQSAQYMTARDLGLTSMQIQQQGLQNTTASMAIAPTGYGNANQTLQAPVTTGVNATSLINAYRAPMVNPDAIYATQLGITSGAGIINPTSAYSTNASMYSSAGQQVLGANQFAADQHWNQVNYNAQQAAQASAAQSSMFSLFGGVAGAGLGAAAGGPMGAMAGYGIGSSMGGAGAGVL